MAKSASKSAPSRAAQKKGPAVPPTTVIAAPKGKLGQVVDLLRRDEGARLDELMILTGWQAHSVRGAIAGAVKKLGFTVVSEKSDGGRVYRITAPQAAS
jgi:hypothetical protein